MCPPFPALDSDHLAAVLITFIHSANLPRADAGSTGLLVAMRHRVATTGVQSLFSGLKSTAVFALPYAVVFHSVQVSCTHKPWRSLARNVPPRTFSMVILVFVTHADHLGRLVRQPFGHARPLSRAKRGRCSNDAAIACGAQCCDWDLGFFCGKQRGELHRVSLLCSALPAFFSSWVSNTWRLCRLAKCLNLTAPCICTRVYACSCRVPMEAIKHRAQVLGRACV